VGAHDQDRKLVEEVLANLEATGLDLDDEWSVGPLREGPHIFGVWDADGILRVRACTALQAAHWAAACRRKVYRALRAIALRGCMIMKSETMAEAQRALDAARIETFREPAPPAYDEISVE
jgi:hypothetical protein